MKTLGTRHYLFQGHSLDIVCRFENFSRVMLNSIYSISSTRVVGSRAFWECLRWIQKHLVLRRDLENVGPDKGGLLGPQELEEPKEPFAENAGLA